MVFKRSRWGYKQTFSWNTDVILAKTKPQYQSDKNNRQKSGLRAGGKFIFRITHRDSFIFAFLRKSTPSWLFYLVFLAGGVMIE